MSVITDVMLIWNHHGSSFAYEPIEALNKKIPQDRSIHEQKFYSLNTTYAGGYKEFITEVYAAALNKIDPSIIREAVAEVEWESYGIMAEHVLYVENAYDYGAQWPVSYSVHQLRTM